LGGEVAEPSASGHFRPTFGFFGAFLGSEDA
jgi:hypothetical protein